MIEIISRPRKEGGYWLCDLWITQESTTWYLPATAPGSLQESELQAHFEAQESELWDIAQRKQRPPDIFENVGAKRIIKALALVMLDEVNRSREADGEDTLTKKEWKQMILDKLKGT